MTIKPLLGIPYERTGAVNYECFAAFLRIARQGWDMVSTDYGRTDVVRNRMAQVLLKTDHTHLIMLDADHVHPPSVVKDLLRWVDKDRDAYQVVGGLNYRRGKPYEACAFLRDERGVYYTYEDWPAGLHRVAVVGTGCICIDRRVFETIPPPWFAYEYPQTQTDDGSFNWPGEDTYFAHQCEKYGIAQWVDTRITSPHAVTLYVDGEFGRRWRESHGNQGTDTH